MVLGVRVRPRAVLLLLIFVCLLSGCSDSEGVTSSSQGQSTTSSKENGKLIVRSPVVKSREVIPRRYSCQEKEVWLPLEIAGVPSQAVELILVASRSGFHRDKGEKRAQLISLNLLGSISPDLKYLEVGAQPAGSFWKKHYKGFCPDASEVGISGFVFVVYAMRNRLAEKLKKIVYLYPSEVDELERSAIASGSLAVLYKNEASRGGG